MQVVESIFGVDVAKHEVVVAHHGAAKGSTQTFKNNVNSLTKWLTLLPAGSTVAMEATGGYERLLADLAYARGLRVYVLNPRPLHHYAKAQDQRGKTDPLDAAMIARYVALEQDRLHRYKPTPEHIELVRQLQKMRGNAVTARTSMRLASGRHHLVQSLPKVQETLDKLKDLAESLEQLIVEQIEAQPELAEDFHLVTSITGIGNLTGAALATTFARIPFRSSDALVAYAGLDPRPRESGTFRGKRKLSKQGDAALRSLAYNAASSASRNAAFKPLYQSLLAKGLATTAALNIIARKLLRIAFGIWKSRKTFDLEFFIANQAIRKP